MSSTPQTGSRIDLATGPIGPTLLRLAAPMVAGIVAVMLFSVIDTVFVGRLGGKQLAAISFTFPVAYFVINLAVGIGIGLSSVISRAIGGGDRDRVRRTSTDGFALAVAVVTAVVLPGLLTVQPLFLLLGAGEDLVPLIRSYMVPWYFGVGFLVVSMVGNGVIRATGDTRVPALIMVGGGIVNIVLDPLLIFGIGPFPRLELQGAAIASAIAWVCSFLATGWVVAVRDRMLDPHLHALRTILDSWRDILYVAVPAAATNILFPLSVAVLTRMLSDYGPAAVAGFGVGSRIESLALVGGMAMSAAMAPFVGQNFGAERRGRVRKGLQFSLVFCLVLGGAICFALGVLALPLARLFTTDPEVIRYASLFLWIVPVSYGAVGVVMQINATFNAINRPLRSTTIAFIRLFVLMIPCAYVGGRWFGVPGILIGVSSANLLGGVVAYGMVRRLLLRAQS